MVIHRKMRFSQHFSEKFKIPLEKINLFFENEFQPCLIGKADLKQKIKKYLPIWGWQKSVDELLQYWFECENIIDNQIIGSVQKLRNDGIKCFLSTNNEKYRVEYLLNIVGLKKYFDGIFFSSEIGYMKQKKEFWQIVYNRLGNPDKESVLCWDDEAKKLEAAKKLGFLAELYTDFKNYENKINYYLTKN